MYTPPTAEHLSEFIRRAHRAHALLNANLCDAADFFSNDVQMVWPSCMAFSIN
jgi:hypothetical protein